MDIIGAMREMIETQDISGIVLVVSLRSNAHSHFIGTPNVDGIKWDAIEEKFEKYQNAGYVPLGFITYRDYDADEERTSPLAKRQNADALIETHLLHLPKDTSATVSQRDTALNEQVVAFLNARGVNNIVEGNILDLEIGTPSA